MSDLIRRLETTSMCIPYDNEVVDEAIDRIKSLEQKLVDAEKANEWITKTLTSYQVAINLIDDFFEYTNKSKPDREFVQNVLCILASEITPPQEKESNDGL